MYSEEIDMAELCVRAVDNKIGFSNGFLRAKDSLKESQKERGKQAKSK